MASMMKNFSPSFRRSSSGGGAKKSASKKGGPPSITARLIGDAPEKQGDEYTIEFESQALGIRVSHNSAGEVIVTDHTPNHHEAIDKGDLIVAVNGDHFQGHREELEAAVVNASRPLQLTFQKPGPGMKRMATQELQQADAVSSALETQIDNLTPQLEPDAMVEPELESIPKTPEEAEVIAQGNWFCCTKGTTPVKPTHQRRTSSNM